MKPSGKINEYRTKESLAESFIHEQRRQQHKLIRQMTKLVVVNKTIQYCLAFQRYSREHQTRFTFVSIIAAEVWLA